MKIELFKSAVCPRCMYVHGILKELQKEHQEIEIDPLDIATNLKRWKEAGVKVFPALKIGEEIKAWYVPKKDEIVEFVESQLQERSNVSSVMS